MLSRRGLLVVAVVAVVLLGSALFVLFSGGNNDQTDDSPGGTSQTVPSTHAPIEPVARGPKPPATGAWTGAWVRPDIPTQQGQLDAVSSFERAIGRPLDVVQVYHQWDDDFPSQADKEFVKQGKVLLLSWSGTDTRVITSGQYDDLIRTRAREVKALGAPILLRFRWEMNRPNLQGSMWSPADFVKAWDHVRTIFTEEGATNAGWVWCPQAANFDATNGPAFYPGDDQVDWLCADVYPGQDYRSFADVSAEFLAWAASHPKPVIIGEYGAEDRAPGQREAWLKAIPAFVKAHPQIKGLVYFDSRKTENGRERDFSLVSGTGPMQVFQQMADDPFFRPKGTGG
jgi:nitrogen fixation-related uncharacterized protein